VKRVVAVSLLSSSLAFAATVWAAPPTRYDSLASAGYGVTITARLNDPNVAEISGIAPSRRDDDLLWAINDSGNGAEIYALSSGGQLRGRVIVDGARNIDWEDIAPFERDGIAYLLIADSGDNGGSRRLIDLYVVREPELPASGGDLHVPVEYRLRVRWPDGPRDCEAVTVDAIANEVLLLSKRRVPAQLFRVSLAPPTRGNRVRLARQIAVLPHIPQPEPEDAKRWPQMVRYISQITGVALSPDSMALAVLSYRDAYLFRRTPGEAWNVALQRLPQRLDMPPLVQAEAIGFARTGGTVWISTEKLPAPIVRFDPPPSASQSTNASH
jgi:hypothetical protein